MREVVRVGMLTGSRLKRQLQSELNDSRRFPRLNDRLRARRRYRRAAGLPEESRPDTRRTRRGVPRVIEIGVVERVEELRAELQINAFGQREPLAHPEVHIPIARRFENVSAHSDLSRRWD